jgi:hypothetical protein
LRELGYVYGEQFVTEARGGEGKPERLPGLAAELVRLQVDVIVAAGPTLPALKQATSTIPVVIAQAGDPVSEGYAQSLGHPGGNFTGISSQQVETTGSDSSCSRSSSLVQRPWESSGMDKASLLGGRQKPPPESGGGSCCRSRFETRTSSREP